MPNKCNSSLALFGYYKNWKNLNMLTLRKFAELSILTSEIVLGNFWKISKREAIV